MKLGLGGSGLALVAALFLAAGAEQARGFVYPAGKSMQMQLRGSHGYRVDIEARGRHMLLVNVSNGRSLVIYWIRNALIDQEGIVGVLPGIGRVAVEFQPRGKPTFEQPFPGCKGRPERTQEGVFVGTVKLRGERGFTTVDSQRARGQVHQSFGQTCGDDGVEDSPGIEQVTFRARGDGPRGDIYFSASFSGIESGLSDGLASFTASMSEQRRGLNIDRLTLAQGSPKTFAFDPPSAPTSASIRPPKPFTGSSAFSVGADGAGSWTGDLRVSFLGVAKPVRVAGEEFEAELCRGSKCAGQVGK